MKFEVKKNDLFWSFIMPVLIVVTLCISVFPWLAQLLAAPSDTVFTGLNRWSPDYYTYLSYVELGRRGELGARLLMTTIKQGPVYAHLAHTVSGFILGYILNFSSVASYHIARIVYGLIFVLFAVVFFYKLTKSKSLTITAFLFTFFISGFAKIENLNPLKISRYVNWMYELNIIGRPTVPIHYSVGFVFFILCFFWYFRENISLIKKILIFGLLLNLVLLANPFAYMVIGFSFAIYVVLGLIFSRHRKNFIKKDLLTIIIGFMISLPAFLYFQYHLSKVPWGLIGTAPKFYRIAHPPIPYWETFLTMAPIMVFGVLGILIVIFKKTKNNLTTNQVIFLFSWIAAQIFLFVFGDKIKIDPLRSIHGLYYLPLSVFSAYSVSYLADKIKSIFRFKKNLIVLLLLILIFIVTLPNYVLSYHDILYEFTDFRSFSQFSYPTKKQVAAFEWLEKNTLVAKGVLALYEASSLIPSFSGNSTEMEIDHNIKIKFYTNQMAKDEAYNFLKNYNFEYVYFGSQEQYTGGNMGKYRFLKKVFENEEVKIYRVI